MANITLTWKQIKFDVASYTWKAGFVNADEDGKHGEAQASMAEPMDARLIQTNTNEAISDLISAIKKFKPTCLGLGTDTNALDESKVWTIAVSLSDRNYHVDNALSDLAHGYVVAHVVAEWFRPINPELSEAWMKKKVNAGTQLLSALYHKAEPTL